METATAFPLPIAFRPMTSITPDTNETGDTADMVENFAAGLAEEVATKATTTKLRKGNELWFTEAEVAIISTLLDRLIITFDDHDDVERVETIAAYVAKRWCLPVDITTMEKMHIADAMNLWSAPSTLDVTEKQFVSACRSAAGLSAKLRIGGVTEFTLTF